MGTEKQRKSSETEHMTWSQWDFYKGFFTNLWSDGESSAETVHCLVILSTEVEEDAETTLKLRVHLGWVNIGCLQVHGLDVGIQRPARGKSNKERAKRKRYLCICILLNVRDAHSGSNDPNLSLSFSLSLELSLERSRSLCSQTEWYFGLCFSQSRRVSQACLCSDSLVKLTASAMRAVRLSFFSSIHLWEEWWQ